MKGLPRTVEGKRLAGLGVDPFSVDVGAGLEQGLVLELRGISVCQLGQGLLERSAYRVRNGLLQGGRHLGGDSTPEATVELRDENCDGWRWLVG